MKGNNTTMLLTLQCHTVHSILPITYEKINVVHVCKGGGEEQKTDVISTHGSCLIVPTKLQRSYSTFLVEFSNVFKSFTTLHPRFSHHRNSELFYSPAVFGDESIVLLLLPPGGVVEGSSYLMQRSHMQSSSVSRTPVFTLRNETVIDMEVSAFLHWGEFIKSMILRFT